MRLKQTWTNSIQCTEIRAWLHIIKQPERQRAIERAEEATIKRFSKWREWDPDMNTKLHYSISLRKMNLHGSLRGSQPCIVSLIMALSDEASTDKKTHEDVEGGRGYLKADFSSLKAACRCFRSSAWRFFSSCSCRISVSKRLDSLMACTCIERTK